MEILPILPREQPETSEDINRSFGPRFLFLPRPGAAQGFPTAPVCALSEMQNPGQGAFLNAQDTIKILNVVSQYHCARWPSDSQKRAKYLNQYHKPETQIPFPSSLP